MIKNRFFLMICFCMLFVAGSKSCLAVEEAAELKAPVPVISSFLHITWNSSPEKAKAIIMARPDTVYGMRIARIASSGDNGRFFDRYYSTFGNIPAVIDLEFSGPPGNEKFVYGMAYMPQPRTTLQERFELFSKKLTEKYGIPVLFEQNNAAGVIERRYGTFDDKIVSVSLSVKRAAFYTDDPDIPGQFKSTDQGILIEYRYDDLTKRQLADFSDQDI